MLVHFYLSSEDLLGAPENVRAFILEKSGLLPVGLVIDTKTADSSTEVVDGPEEVEVPAKKTRKSKASKAKTEDKTEDPGKSDVPTAEVTRGEAMDAAIKFMETHGEEKLVPILKEMGLSRLRDCPDEHLPEFLSRLAVAA